MLRLPKENSRTIRELRGYLFNTERVLGKMHVVMSLHKSSTSINCTAPFYFVLFFGGTGG